MYGIAKHARLSETNALGRRAPIRPGNVHWRSVFALRLGGRMMMVLGSAARLHLLVLFFLFLEDLRSSQTSLLGQVANVAHNFPHFVLFQDAFPCRHTRGIDAVDQN